MKFSGILALFSLFSSLAHASELVVMPTTETFYSAPDLPLNYEREPRLVNCDNCELNDRGQSQVTLAAADGTAHISVLSMEQAQQLFTEMRSGPLGEGIDFSDFQDGCHARAHILHDRLLQRGVRTGKILITGNSGFQYEGPNGQKYFYKWSYHIAPMVYVRDGGKLKLMVYDPTLFNRLVPATEWIRKLNSHPPSTFEGLYLTSGMTYKPEPDMTVAPSSFARYRGDLQEAYNMVQQRQGQREMYP